MTKPIISFIVLILSVGFAFFYVKPAYSLVQERRNDIVSLTNILDNSSKIKTLIDQTTQNLNSVDTTELSRFAVFLPEKIDVLRFANNIGHIGLMNGMVLQDIKVENAANGAQNTAAGSSGAVQGLVNTFSLGSKIQQAQGGTVNTLRSVASTGNNYATTKASFMVTATYEKFQLFLNSLEKSLGLINVTSLSFSPILGAVDVKKVKSTAPPMYQYAVTIETYSLK